MAEIIPAILPESRQALELQLAMIRGIARSVQIDMVDGAYAPNTTWPYTINRRPTIDDVQFPFGVDFHFEMDLMVAHAADIAALCVQAGARRIIVHADAPGAHEALQALQHVSSEKAPVTRGIALSPASDFAAINTYEGLYDFVQVMGIAHVGFQGQRFDARALELIRTIRIGYPALPIQVDGGVNHATIPDLLAAGATRLVVGSAIWASENPLQAIQSLHALVNSLLQ
jgi:ribulose-phosphate 3-epimerase